jgi:hypothetical protein
MTVSLGFATDADIQSLLDLQLAVDADQQRRFGTDRWSTTITDRSIARGLKSSRVLIAKQQERIVGGLRMATKKPWAIDLKYFTPVVKAVSLHDVNVDIPLGVLVVVTGVAGAGKSSLIYGSVSGRDGVVSVDQTPIRGSRRSNPATYTGLLDPIRKAFAKANGVKPALFSANSEGACPTCNGAGVIYTDLAMMAGVTTVCEECQGRRFQAAVLEYRLGGTNIAGDRLRPGTGWVFGFTVETASTRTPAAGVRLSAV